MLNLNKEIKYIKGVGPARATLLNKLGIYTLEDLCFYFPRTYEDRGKPKNIAEVIDGEEVLIEAICTSKMSVARIRKNMTVCKLRVSDDTGSCQITWFNQTYLKDKFVIGERYKFYGKVKARIGYIEMNSPVYDSKFTTKNTGKIIPIYPLTYELSRKYSKTNY